MGEAKGGGGGDNNFWLKFSVVGVGWGTLEETMCLGWTAQCFVSNFMENFYNRQSWAYLSTFGWNGSICETQNPLEEFGFEIFRDANGTRAVVNWNFKRLFVHSRDIALMIYFWTCLKFITPLIRIVGFAKSMLVQTSWEK